jgi:hypothetical protein
MLGWAAWAKHLTDEGLEGVLLVLLLGIGLALII